jgi:hypothetical protein
MAYQKRQTIQINQIISRVLGIMGLMGVRACGLIWISACGVRVNWINVSPSILDGCSLCFALTKPLGGSQWHIRKGRLF